MPVSTRQPTPGPSTTISGAIPPQIHSGNSKKRSGSEATEDTRDAKKAKVEGGALPSMSLNGKQKDKDKKKKKRKKKRRTSVVLAFSQPREREMSKPLSSTVPTSIPKRKSSEVTNNGHAKSESENETALSSSDKGKGKAKSQSPRRRVATPVTESEQPVASSSGSSNSNIISDQTSEINRLKELLATQAVLLERHQTHLSNHQQSITCQICLDLMYKPYALAPCGHTTCYGCLVRWFTSPTNPQVAGGANPDLPDAHNEGIEAILNSPNARNGAYLRRRKNCPVCRAVVSERPIEMWGIKGMVAALIKSGLVEFPIPLEPVVEENGDNNNDPWRNIFRRGGPPNGRHPHPPAPMGFPGHPAPPVPLGAPADERADMGWYDAEDGGIYRCNECYHEILYGRCTRCQRVYPGHAGYDDDDDDDDDDGFDADELHIRGGIQRFIDALMVDGNGDEDEDEDEEDIDEDMFLPPWDIGPEEDDEEDEEFMDGPQHPHDHPLLHRQIERDIFDPPEEDEEDEEAHDEDFFAIANRYYHRRQPVPQLRRARIEEVQSEDENEEGSDYEGSFIDDGDEHEVLQPGEVVEVVDDDDDDSEDDEVDVLDRPPGEPLPVVRPEVIDLTDEDEENADEDEDGPPGGQRRYPVRFRPQILAISSDEDEDENGARDNVQYQYHIRQLRNRAIIVDDDDSHGEEGESEEEDRDSNR